MSVFDDYWNSVGPGGARNLLGGGKQRNPADAAQEYLDQISGTVKPYYTPYVEAGQKALPQLQEQYNKLVTDPGAMLKQLSQGYKESPGYQFRQQQGQGAALNASAAGGMAGSPQHQQFASQVSSDIASQDYENYLNHVLGLYGGGLKGTSDLEQQGATMGSDLASILANVLGTKGQYAFTGQAGENQRKSQQLSNILSLLGLAGGAMVGGPAGASIGANIGGQLAGGGGGY